MPKLLLGRTWNTAVRLREPGLLLASTHYIDDQNDLEAWIKAEASTFAIQESGVQVYRGKEGVGVHLFPALEGETAYPGIGQRVKAAVDSDPTGHFVPLLLENIKGFLQAEAFLYSRRGYGSLRQYWQYFAREFKDTCIYYHHPELVNLEEDPGQREGRPGEILFARQRVISLAEREGGLTLSADLLDTFHHLRLELELSPEREVQQARGHILRGPHPICGGAEQAVCSLVDDPTPHPRRWQKGLSGPEGCTHLADLAREAAVTLLD